MPGGGRYLRYPLRGVPGLHKALIRNDGAAEVSCAAARSRSARAALSVACRRSLAESMTSPSGLLTGLRFRTTWRRMTS